MFMDVKAPITLRVASSWRSQSRSGIEAVRISGKHKSIGLVVRMGAQTLGVPVD